METTGRGQILVSAFGDVEKIELDGHSPVLHLVADILLTGKKSPRVQTPMFSSNI
jgi:uncharacterized protein (AIM24 family)